MDFSYLAQFLPLHQNKKKHVGPYISSQALTSACLLLEIYCTILSPLVYIWYYFMETQIAAMDESYFKSLAAFMDRSNYWEVYVNALSKISMDVKLGGVRSCLTIGPNEGLYEIEFLKHC